MYVQRVKYVDQDVASSEAVDNKLPEFYGTNVKLGTSIRAIGESERLAKGEQLVADGDVRLGHEEKSLGNNVTIWEHFPHFAFREQSDFVDQIEEMLHIRSPPPTALGTVATPHPAASRTAKDGMPAGPGAIAHQSRLGIKEELTIPGGVWRCGEVSTCSGCNNHCRRDRSAAMLQGRVTDSERG